MRAVLSFALGLWVFGTTALYTLLVVPPILAAAVFSRGGRAPFFFGRLWSWMLLKTHRVRVVAIGGELLQPDHSYVFISNHASHLDSPAIALSLPHTLRFIGKMSLSRIPFFGWATRRIGIIYIDRNDPENARRTLSTAGASLTGGVSTLFYAEGTRTTDGRLQPFKKGGVMLALKTGLPIVPITVVGSRTLMPKHALRIRPGTIRVIIGPPIETVGKSPAQRDALIETVRAHIQDTLHRYPHDQDAPSPAMIPAASPEGTTA
ncbi:MAG: lysophospholipid acyltransferase family protein [Pseudomonadota bacterium]